MSDAIVAVNTQLIFSSKISGRSAEIVAANNAADISAKDF
jgi:hypothetical protein